MTTHPRKQSLLQLPILFGMGGMLMGIIYLFDRNVADEIAIGMAYTVVILFSAFFPAPLYSTVMGLLCSALIVTDAVLGEIGSAIIVDKILSLATIWITVLLLLLTKRQSYQTKKLNESLGEKVRERTATLQNKLAELNASNRTIHNTYSRLLKANNQNRASEQRFRHLLQSAPDAMVFVSHEGTIKLINHEVTGLFARHENELLDAPLSSLIVEDVETIFRQAAQNNGDAGFELTGKRNGSGFPAEVSVSPLAEDEEIAYILAIRDISERKRARESLNRYASVLENKNKELEQFAYIASHDLQEPLRTVQNISSLLRPGNEEEKLRIGFIRDASERMSALIRGLLDYSRIGQNAKREAVDLNDLVATVTADMSATIAESNAIIETSQLPIVEGYPTELRILLQNLISNAVKFRRPDATPRVGISATEKNDNWQLSVTDNGIGIKTKHMDRIFLIFQRLNERSQYQGHGIGLAHCNKIIKLHDGEIWVESAPGSGSTFHFSIPKQAKKAIDNVELYSTH